MKIKKFKDQAQKKVERIIKSNHVNSKNILFFTLLNFNFNYVAF